MSGGSTILGLLFVASGLLVVALCIPLALGRVAMNPLYGIRLAKAFESDSSWYAINAYGGRVMALVGAAIAVLGAAVWILRPESAVSVVLLAFAPIPLVLLGVVPIVRFSRRLP